jgi:hypothetical protein
LHDKIRNNPIFCCWRNEATDSVNTLIAGHTDVIISKTFSPSR